MKVIGIVASPRKKGNTHTLVESVLEGAKGKGAETEIFFLDDMDLRGCTACNSCKKDGVCCFDDDIWSLLMKMQEADGIVFGSPIYYWQMASQMRILLDRTFAFLKPDFTTRWNTGKKTVIITSQGNPDPSAFDGTTREFAKIMEDYNGFKVIDRIVMVNGNDPSAAGNDPGIMARAKDAGSAMVD